jgi:hypothetical protein
MHVACEYVLDAGLDVGHGRSSGRNGTDQGIPFYSAALQHTIRVSHAAPSKCRASDGRQVLDARSIELPNDEFPHRRVITALRGRCHKPWQMRDRSPHRERFTAVAAVRTRVPGSAGEAHRDAGKRSFLFDVRGNSKVFDFANVGEREAVEQN